jgi:hypothetical protein
MKLRHYNKKMLKPMRKYIFFAEKQKNTRVKRKQPAESSSEDELCGTSDDISDDKS